MNDTSIPSRIVRSGRTLALLAAAWGAALVVGAAPGWGQGIQVAPGEQGRLRADRLRYDARAQIFTAEGNVHLTLGTLEIRAARLRLEQRTQIAYASGGVTARQGEFALGAAQVTYEIKTRIARAAGGVSLSQKDVAVRTPRVTYTFGPQTVSASGGVTVVQGGSKIGRAHV